MIGTGHKYFFATATVFFALTGPASSDAARLVAELSQQRIYFGTQTLLTAEVSDAGGTGWPAVEPVPGLTIERYGRPRRVRDLLSGKATVRYTFLLTPEKPGRYEIPEVTLRTRGAVLKDGPFTLQVAEAPLKFRRTNIDPSEILVGETAVLDVYYQGVRPDVTPDAPQVDGLAIRATQLGRVEVDERRGVPLTIHRFEIRALKLGSYRIPGITFDGVASQPVALTVAPFVVVGSQINESSLVVGGQTTAHVLIRGLPDSAAVSLRAPSGVRIARSKQRFRSRERGSLFSFDVTPTEPGDFSIDTLQLPGDRTVTLSQPLVLSVRQAGAGNIFACRGIPQSEETVVGEPFVVDYEVYFRGEFRGAALDVGQALFMNKDYIKVEPVNDLSHTDWQGRPTEARFGRGRIRMMLGTGEYNGQKEQLLRFALRITPLATGELSLDGLQVVLLLQIREERRTATSFFSTTQTRNFSRVAEVPPHYVIDPPGTTRPANYRDAVGSTFAFVTELDRTAATAMSPLTLTMKITGESVGPQFKPPPLAEVPELTRDFDVSPTVHGGEVADNTIAFTQIVRPRSEEVTELPALPLVYYDYQQKEYKTVYSMPISLEVKPGSLVGAAAMEAVASPTTPAGGQRTGQTAAAPTGALGANFTTLGDVVAAPLGATGLLLLLVAGPLAITLIAAGRWAYRKRQPLAATNQQRRTLLQSLGRLDAAEHFHARLAEIVQSYLRLSFDLPPGELSAGALAKVFDDGGLDNGLRDETLDILSACDAGRFAVGAVDDHDKTRLSRRARELFKKLDRITE